MMMSKWRTMAFSILALGNDDRFRVPTAFRDEAGEEQ